MVELSSLRKAGLYPHQAQFVKLILESDSAPYHHLIAPPGTGKSESLCVLADLLVNKYQAKRLLILTDTQALQNYFEETLGERISGIPVRAIDKKTFRELETRVSIGTSPWDKPILGIMTFDIAAQKQVSRSLTSAKWDLIAIEHVYRLKEVQNRLVDHLLDADAARKLLLISSSPDEPGSMIFSRPLAVTEWNRDLPDWDGSPLFSESLHKIVRYRRTREEIAFLKHLRNLYGGTHSKSFMEYIASSSLYAIEQSLRRRRNRLAHSASSRSSDGVESKKTGRSSGFDTENVDLLEASNYEFVRPDLPPSLELTEIDALLKELDRINKDAKLQSLTELLEQLSREDDIIRICTFSSFASTVSYLYSSLTEIRHNVYHVIAAMSIIERKRVIEQFATKGGILIASSAVIIGVEPEPASVGINYDLPQGHAEVSRRQAFVNRPTDEGGVPIFYAFVDESKVLPSEEIALRRHGFIDT